MMYDELDQRLQVWINVFSLPGSFQSLGEGLDLES
jgi:hypothetical protein